MFRKSRNNWKPPEYRAGNAGEPIETFADRWQQITTDYVHPGSADRQQTFFNVRPELAEWAERTIPAHGGEQGHSGNVYAAALRLGAFTFHAALNGRTPVLLTPGRQQYELPELSKPFNTDGAVTRQAELPRSDRSIVNWAELYADGGFPLMGSGRDRLIHVGAHILGGMTELPEGSRLAVVGHAAGSDGGPVVGAYSVPIAPLNLAGAPPFPPTR